MKRPHIIFVACSPTSEDCNEPWTILAPVSQYVCSHIDQCWYPEISSHTSYWRLWHDILVPTLLTPRSESGVSCHYPQIRQQMRASDHIRSCVCQPLIWTGQLTFFYAWRPVPCFSVEYPGFGCDFKWYTALHILRRPITKSTFSIVR